MTVLHVSCYCSAGQACSELQSSAEKVHTCTITLQLQNFGADMQASTLITWYNNCTGPQRVVNVLSCHDLEDASNAYKQIRIILCCIAKT